MVRELPELKTLFVVISSQNGGVRKTTNTIHIANIMQAVIRDAGSVR